MELYEKYEDYIFFYIFVNFSCKYFFVVIIYVKCSNCLMYVNLLIMLMLGFIYLLGNG